jgi:hypothetical protein
VALTITAAQASSASFTPGQSYVWDLRLTDSLSVPRRYIRGNVIILDGFKT